MELFWEFQLHFFFVSYDVWRSYFIAMPIHGKVHLGSIKITTEKYPHINIEDMKDLWIWARLPISDSSIQGIARKYLGIKISPDMLIIGLIICIFISIILFLRVNKFYKNTEFLFLFAVLVLLISELFLPAARFSYNNVFLLVILSLIVINSEIISKLLKKK